MATYDDLCDVVKVVSFSSFLYFYSLVGEEVMYLTVRNNNIMLYFAKS